MKNITRQKIFIKICGQTHQSASDNASACGAAALGFIFHPRSPRFISPAQAAKIQTTGVQRVGVFVKQGATEICDIMQQARLHYAQLHGNQSIEEADIIGPDKVIRVLWPERYTSPADLQADLDLWCEHCAYFLLDAGTQGGGHGTALNLDKLKQVRFPKPWILAGGLHAESLQAILSKCQPDGLDFNSGLEDAPGFKNPRRILNAMHSSMQNEV